MEFPADKGTYILIMAIAEPQTLTIGRRGTFDLPTGDYAYVGSAFGAGGLSGRLKHHLSPVTKPHWHVDYLRAVAPVQAVWYAANTTVYEHVWAHKLIGLPGAVISVPRFGASDCRCPTHLIAFPNRLDFAVFGEVCDTELVQVFV